MKWRIISSAFNDPVRWILSEGGLTIHKTSSTRLPKTSVLAFGRKKQTDPWVWAQAGLKREFQKTQDFAKKPCLKKHHHPTPLKKEKNSHYKSSLAYTICFKLLMSTQSLFQKIQMQEFIGRARNRYKWIWIGNWKECLYRKFFLC